MAEPPRVRIYRGSSWYRKPPVSELERTLPIAVVFLGGIFVYIALFGPTIIPLYADSAGAAINFHLNTFFLLMGFGLQFLGGMIILENPAGKRWIKR